MVSLRRNNSHAYTTLEKEDPKEKSHREAQFLIYKTMKQADQMASSSKSSWLILRICKLKVKVGKKFIRLRKTMLCNMSKTTKVGVCKHFMGRLKTFKRLFTNKGRAINHLPRPIFTI